MKRFSFFILLLSLTIPLLFLLTACNDTVRYTDYLSEYRSEIYKGEQDGFQVTVFFSFREYPYDFDGVCATRQNVIEIFFTAPDNTKTYEVFLETPNDVGGEASYDSVYNRFSYSQSSPCLSKQSIPVIIHFEETKIRLQVNSVKTGKELPMPDILNKLATQQKELFNSMQQGNRFLGELRVRLTYNENPYYFVCVTSTDKQTSYFLLDAYSGDILAERNG